MLSNLLRVLIVAVGLFCATLSATSRADDGLVVKEEAAKHFGRGVVLYGEADYPAALVEFKRALDLAPNEVVLYNIGQTHYQLRDYAAALAVFEQYLARASNGDARRAEVEANTEILKTRVGTLRLTTEPAGAEISINDQVIGTTPFDQPLRVNIGRLRLTASVPGRAPVVRFVEVAAEEEIRLNLTLAGADAAVSLPEGQSSVQAGQVKASADVDWKTVGWLATGTLGAAAITFGVLALGKSDDLAAARDAFPTTARAIERARDSASTYALLADVFTASTLIVGGITLYSTLSSPKDEANTALGNARLTLGVRSVRLETSF